MKIVSLFSGCGGLDLGFEKAGFNVIWANEYDKNFWSTYRHNFPKTYLETKSVTAIKTKDIPDCDGIIGGPPCQSWSAIGSHRGIEDERGQLFLNDYVRIIKAKKPKFFVAENVPGMMYEKHSTARNKILKKLKNLGYNVSYQLLNTNDYDVPQTRKRVIMVGYASDYATFFYPPKPASNKLTLQDQIGNIYNKYPNPPKVKTGASVNKNLALPNHEYMDATFSYIYMSRNRVRSWDEPSFTIQASGRHAPCHPQAPKFTQKKPKVKDVLRFEYGSSKLYRRLTIRECASIQTFPDSFIFKYNNIDHGYKMIGNAVPVNFAKHLALTIKADMKKLGNQTPSFDRAGKIIFNE
ncbi:DNA cytosine methyltransferase [Gammaproteobacteria bacterium]|nr:DNA cytosine methyltransferase [Gammaproteobacteria bacterium]